MGRIMNGDASAAYRAVITRTLTYKDGTTKVYTSYAGPYGTKGPASAAITRDARWDGEQGYGDNRYQVKTEGFVERAPMQWERVTGGE